MPGELAEPFGRADDVEDVVAELEHHAEAATEIGQRVDLIAPRPPVSAPMRHDVAINAAVLPAMAL